MRSNHKFWDSFTDFFFLYQTPRVVTLRSKRIGVIYRILQSLLLLYLVGYVFIWTKSYQETDVADTSTVTKVKGMLKRVMNGQTQIWDSNDFVVPPQETEAFFVATNLIYTENQTQGICPEDENVGRDGIACAEDFDCDVGLATPYGNGIKTGKCIQKTGTCEISGWCPTETDETPKKPVLSGFETVTVLVKNHIAFSKFGVKRRNILESFSQKYLQTCRFHPINDKLCPIFSIVDMVKFAEEDMEALAVRGGIIGFHIHWDCNLDLGIDQCLPKYSFRRLDHKDDKVARGWNFRHAYYFYDAKGTSRRDLIKFWGIRFIFVVSGTAGKFSWVLFVMHLGSSLGLFGIVALICEFVLSSCFKSQVLAEQKFVNLELIKARRRSSTGGLQSDGSIQLHSLLPTPYNSTRHLIDSRLSTPATTRLARVTPVAHLPARRPSMRRRSSEESQESLPYMDTSPVDVYTEYSPRSPHTAAATSAQNPENRSRDYDGLDWV